MERMKTLSGLVAWLCLGLAPLAAADTCGRLATLKLPQGSITLAQPVAAGAFVPPAGGGPNGAGAFKALPALCRVAAILRPSLDSDIKIEVWLPVSGWNGNLQSVGNGAWAGTISYPAMATALADGYATASTDTGHSGNNADFILGHPEKVADFVYRAVHEMTVAAKALTQAYYGKPVQFAYWNGCSTGGKQALSEAQRFPDDYDGILAGAAAINTTHLQGMQTWVAAEAHKDEAAYIPPDKYSLLHNAVLETCDALDGVKDGVLEDPTRCHFDPQVLACRNGDAPTCLTAPQVKLARKIYAGPKDAQGRALFDGLLPGSEMGWASLAGPKAMSLAVETYQYLVFKDPRWDFRTFDAAKDIARADKDIGESINSTDPNLKPFFAEHGGHSGKLLMYHGWADPGITPLNSVTYYKSVVDTVGGSKQASDSIRLFMIPGMGHCRGGDGTDTFGGIAALAAWVEKGKAPERIEASHATKGVIDKARPLCPYPQTAVYKGTGDTNDSANFVCRAR
jgi:feruloyl esterase